MVTSFKSWMAVLGLVMSLSACMDHQVGGPQAPARLRLKTVGGSTYTYDSQNRLTLISHSTGARLEYSYKDAEQRPSLFRRYDITSGGQTNGTPYTISYGPGSVLVQQRLSDFTPPAIPGTVVLTNYQYLIDANNRLTALNTLRGDIGRSNFYNEYSSTGDNITKGIFRFGPSSFATTPTGNDVYAYDDKVNPYFGMVGQSTNDIRPFSRNNLVKVTAQRIDPATSEVKTTITEYEYEYNQQNLPIRIRQKGHSEWTTLTYESY